MSLRLQITALFGAILLVTMGVAAYLGQSIAARAVEEAVQQRTVEVARGLLSEIDLTRDMRDTDRIRIAERLAAALARHRGLRTAELGLRKPGKDDVIRIVFGKSGPETTFEQRDLAFSSKIQSRLTGDGDQRVRLCRAGQQQAQVGADAGRLAGGQGKAPHGGHRRIST